MSSSSYNSRGCRALVYAILVIAALVLLGSLLWKMFRGCSGSGCGGSGFGLGAWIGVGRNQCSSGGAAPATGFLWVPIVMIVGALLSFGWFTLGVFIGMHIAPLIPGFASKPVQYPSKRRTS